jgi:poly(A) polymerase
MLKLFMGGHALANFEMLRHYELFGRLFPFTEQSLTHEEQHFPLTLICRGMENTDVRIAQGKPVTPAFLFALFLWQPVRERAAELEASGQHKAEALQHAGSQIIAEQAGIMALPKRFSLPMREIWMLQLRLERTGGRRSLRVLGHPRFRAAYDFLLLRGEAGEVSAELGEWWTDFQEKNPQQAVTSDNKPGQGKGRRRRRPRSRSGGNKS